MEELARQGIQNWLQGLLEEEVTEFWAALATTGAAPMRTGTATAMASGGG